MEISNWCVEIWGSRGSYPRPEERFLKYGGNTSCVSLTHDGGIVILDAGSGLIELGRRLDAGASVAKPGKGLLDAGASVAKLGRRLDILLSHVHLDHVQGLPSFLPFYRSDMDIHLHGQVGMRKSLEMIIGPPYWPVGFADFAAGVTFHELRPGERFSLNGLEVSTLAGNHPGGSLLYRLDGVDGARADAVGTREHSDGMAGEKKALGNRSLVYALDCETDEKMLQELAVFVRDADLLLWDAGFTSEDLKPGWGHSTWERGMETRRLARAKKVVMMHYNAEYDDAFLQCLEEKARQQDKAVLFAREGMKLC